MNALLLLTISGISILVILISIYFGIKKCCSSKRQFPENFIPKNSYAAPGSDEAEARLFQRDWLPPADDIEERGGMYEQLAGIQPANQNQKNPWTDGNIHLT